MSLVFNFLPTPPPPSGPGTFDAQIQVADGVWRSIVQDEVVEVLAPAPVRVKIDSIADWATDDLRQIYVETDFGERYTLASHSHVDIPTALRKLGGSTAGLYPGVVCGHSLRGYDMAGNKVLTATYDPGGGKPVGTMDMPLEVYVSDGLASATISCTIRLIHPDVYYADADKTLAATAPEARRWGAIYVSRDGDFTGAPAKRAPTTTLGGIAHVHIPSGEFSIFRFTRNALTNDYGNAGWGSSGYPECVQVLFKSGETYFPTVTFSMDEIKLGRNTTIGTWYPAGATDRAIWSGTGRVSTYSPNPETDSERRGMIAANALSGGSYAGWRFIDLDLQISGYDPSVETWRVWHNILKYTGTGGFTKNTAPGLGVYNGDIIHNGAGVYTQVIDDDGAGTLLVRQVVSNVDTTGGVTQAKIDAFDVVADTFTDGDTLTNTAGTVSVTFVAAGSRQDRVQKTPPSGFYIVDNRGCLIDNCLIVGGSTGCEGIGPGSVISDTVIKNCWNYGVTKTGGGAEPDFSETGVIIVQPLSYEGTPRFFGTGQSVSPNRNFFNVYYTTVDGAQNPIEAHIPAENNVSHSMRRFSRVNTYSQHFCGGRWFGGHGGAHQPMHRMMTDGADAEGVIYIQMHGCFYQGGGAIIASAMANATGVPFTPKAWRIERSHLRADFCNVGQMNFICYSNFVFRNCLFEFPDAPFAASNVKFLAGAEAGPFYLTLADFQATPKIETDPDVNAVSPVIEFCTFIFQGQGATGFTMLDSATSLRGVTWTYRNNAYGVDADKVTGFEAESVIPAQNDDPKLASGFFNADFRPLAGSKAYQSATGFIPAQDAAGATRPSANASKGYREPA